MKKFIILLLSLIFLILMILGIYKYIFNSKNTDFKDKPAAVNVTNKTNSPNENASINKALTKETNNNTAANVQIVPYEIKGVSNNLSAKAVGSMNKWREDIMNTSRENPDLVYTNGASNINAVSLTFDDGPDSNITPKILDVLKENEVHGNFFCIGTSAQNHSSIVKREFEEGNLVLNHSYSHADFTNKSTDFIQNELTKADNILYNIIGKKPLLFRPPYGIVSNNVINIAKNNDEKIIIWSTDTLDWSQKDKYNITKNVLDNVRPGEIILMHCNEDKLATLEALPMIINGLKGKGYSIVTLDKLLNTPAYK